MSVSILPYCISCQYPYCHTVYCLSIHTTILYIMSVSILQDCISSQYPYYHTVYRLSIHTTILYIVSVPILPYCISSQYPHYHTVYRLSIHTTILYSMPDIYLVPIHSISNAVCQNDQDVLLHWVTLRQFASQHAFLAATAELWFPLDSLYFFGQLCVCF